MVYHLIMPLTRNKNLNFNTLPSYVLRILQGVTSIQSATRAWRGVATEVFNHHNFFQMTPEVGAGWCGLIHALHTVDKQVFPELVSRASTTSAGNLFSGKEAETIAKAGAIRRLTCAIFAAGKDSHLIHLAIIQEKLVEVLRSGLSSTILAEIYLCLRVSLVRFSPHNFPGLWPVVITDMINILNEAIHNPPSESDESYCLLVAVCKFIDLAVTVQTQELQTYQWMFITDTVDAIYPPEDWSTRSLLDKLGEVIRNILSEREKQIDAMTMDNSVDLKIVTSGLRRPLLSRVSSTPDIFLLSTFLTHVSLASYESLYNSRGQVDWAEVEESLLSDIFSGR